MVYYTMVQEHSCSQTLLWVCDWPARRKQRTGGGKKLWQGGVTGNRNCIVKSHLNTWGKTGLRYKKKTPTKYHSWPNETHFRHTPNVKAVLKHGIGKQTFCQAAFKELEVLIYLSLGNLMLFIPVHHRDGLHTNLLHFIPLSLHTRSTISLNGLQFETLLKTIQWSEQWFTLFHINIVTTKRIPVWLTMIWFTSAQNSAYMSLAVIRVTGHSLVTEQRSQAVIIRPITRSLWWTNNQPAINERDQIRLFMQMKTRLRGTNIVFTSFYLVFWKDVSWAA